MLANACRGEEPCAEWRTRFMALNRIVLPDELEDPPRPKDARLDRT